LSHWDTWRLALVPWAPGVVSEFRCSDQGCVRVSLRDDAAAGNRSMAAIGVLPAGLLGQVQETDACQPRRGEVGRICAYLPPAISLADLLLARALACFITDDQRGVYEHDRIAAISRGISPHDRFLHPASPPGIQNPASRVDRNDAGLIRGAASGVVTPGE